MTNEERAMAIYMMRDGVTDGRVAEVMGCTIGEVLMLGRWRGAVSVAGNTYKPEQQVRRERCRTAYREKQRLVRQQIKQEVASRGGK